MLLDLSLVFVYESNHYGFFYIMVIRINIYEMQLYS